MTRAHTHTYIGHTTQFHARLIQHAERIACIQATCIIMLAEHAPAAYMLCRLRRTEAQLPNKLSAKSLQFYGMLLF